jgi:predicted ester cyclase
MNEAARLARRWFEEVWNARRAETIDELLTPETHCHLEAGTFKGMAGFRETLCNPVLSGIPDLHITLDAVIGEGENAAVRWTATGTHTGEGLGFAPTGKPVTIRGLSWLTARNGKLVEGWQHSDLIETFRSLATK